MFNIEFDTTKYITCRCPRAKFKGGGGGKPPTSGMTDTETQKYGRETLYPMINRGLEGKGFGTATLTRQKENTLYDGLDDSFNEASADFNSQMSRTLDPADTRVKSYLDNTMNREYLTKKDDIARGLRQENVSDQDTSMAMASDYLSNEKRMTVQGTQMYNNALQTNIANQQRTGTFASNLSSGIGSALGSVYGAQQINAKYAQQMGN